MFAIVAVLMLSLIIELHSYSIPDDYNGSPIVFDGYVSNASTYISMFTPAKDRYVVEGYYKEIGMKLSEMANMSDQGKINFNLGTNWTI